MFPLKLSFCKPGMSAIIAVAKLFFPPLNIFNAKGITAGSLFVVSSIKELKNVHIHTRRRRIQNPQAGLTLVEIIVVLLILSVLVGMLTRGLFSQGERAKAQLNELQMQRVQSYINQYQLRYNRLPPSISSLYNCDENTGPACIPIVDKEQDILDAWGTKLVYRVDSNGRSYSLTSLGSDRREGGTGVEGDATITGP